MELAQKKDINVQLIYCGSDDGTWRNAAHLAHTDLLTIDQNRVTTAIAAPQDDEILRLGNELNSTYIAYGSQGQASMARQKMADATSEKMSKKVAIERMQVKSKKGAYDNTNWDMVDALDKRTDFLENAKEEDLPVEMRGKSLEEKKAIVAAAAQKRADLQAKIAKLEADRAEFIRADQLKNGDKNAPSLDTELMKSTRKAAAKKGYK
jgi:tricorn protease-like protein